MTWRTDRDDDREDFYAYARVERRGDVVRAAVAAGTGRRFRSRLRGAATARFVTVTGEGLPGTTRSTTAEID